MKRKKGRERKTDATWFHLYVKSKKRKEKQKKQSKTGQLVKTECKMVFARAWETEKEGEVMRTNLQPSEK